MASQFNCNILVLCPGIACVITWNNQGVTEITCVTGGLFDERGKNLTKARANEPRSPAPFSSRLRRWFERSINRKGLVSKISRKGCGDLIICVKKLTPIFITWESKMYKAEWCSKRKLSDIPQSRQWIKQTYPSRKWHQIPVETNKRCGVYCAPLNF